MTPDQLAQYRSVTDSVRYYNWKTRYCPCCKKTKSMGQFAEGATVCRRCHG